MGLKYRVIPCLLPVSLNHFYDDDVILTPGYICLLMLQQILIGIIFLLAAGYLGNMIFQSFQAKKSCASGCGKCDAIDFEKIEKQITASKE